MSPAYDVIVIGAGPGGYVAAIRAAQLGLNTAVIEAAHLGGICLNWGCIPTKALLRAADLYRAMTQASAYGLSAEKVGFDLTKIVARSRAVSAQLQAGVTHLLKKNKVTVLDGRGRLLGQGQVGVKDKTGTESVLRAPHIILATGARARILPGLEPDGRLIWTYKEALVPQSLPARLLVVGSGAIGVEFASFYHAFGSHVTIIEQVDRLLPAEDEEISALARAALEKQGMTIKTGARVTGLTKQTDSVTVTLSHGNQQETLTVDRVIVAAGIVGNIEELGLDQTAIVTAHSHLRVSPWLETDEPGVYAIGDLAGPPWLAHKASHEGRLVAERIAGVAGAHPLDPRKIPGCTYSHPQIASVGLSEAKATQAGYQIKVGRFPYRANGKAIALGETDGLVKTIFDAKTGELLGAHIIGADATEMIQGYMIAQTLETTEADLMQAVFPHPTLSEMMHESVLDAYGQAIHF